MWAGLEKSRRSSQMSNNESTIVGDHTKTGRSVHTTAHKHITVCSAHGQDGAFGPDHQRVRIWRSTAGWAYATRPPRMQASHVLAGGVGVCTGWQTQHMADTSARFEVKRLTQTSPGGGELS